MRMLANDIWVFDIIYIFCILFLCLINIFIFSKHKRNLVTFFFHVTSSFLILSLFCNLVDSVILDLWFESFYKACSLIFFVLFVLCVVCLLLIIFYQRHKETGHVDLSQNLEIVFSSVDDLAFIVDFKGNIIWVNHPQKLDLLFKGEKSLNGILNCLDDCYCSSRLESCEIENIKESLQHEILLRETNEYYHMVILPIFTGGIRIGFSVLFVDINEIKKSEICLQGQNKELIEANKKLTNYIKISSVLEAQTAKLNILKNILSILIVKIENSRNHIQKIQNLNNSDVDYKKSIKEIADELRQIYQDVRASVKQIAGEGN